MKNSVFIIPPFDFRDEELFEPKSILENFGIQTDVASTKITTCVGMLGGKIDSTKTLFDIDVALYSAIIFVGGNGTICFWEDSLAHKIATDAVGLNKILAAICIAPVILANAGVLLGKQATCWKSEQGKITSRGAIYTGDRVTYDGNIITANGPESADQFARSIIKSLNIT